MPGKRKPWDKLTEESSRAFAAFAAYRDLGPTRSIRECASETGYGTRQLSEWSRTFNWVSRAEQWDRRVDQVKTRRELTEIERMHGRHVRLAHRLQDVAGIELEIMTRAAERRLKRLEQAEKDGSIDGLEIDIERPHMIGRTLDYATKIERLASGEATERTETKYDLSKLTIEELKTLRAIRRKLGEPVTGREDESEDGDE